MSRSYRKPYWVSGSSRRGAHSKRFEKRLANKRVRQVEEVSDGNAFKKASCSWDIRDYTCYDPESSKVRRK